VMRERRKRKMRRVRTILMRVLLFRNVWVISL